MKRAEEQKEREQAKKDAQVKIALIFQSNFFLVCLSIADIVSLQSQTNSHILVANFLV